MFIEKWNDNEKSKKNLRKESWESGTTKWDSLEQVGVLVTSGTGTGLSPYWVGQDRTGTRGSSD